MSSSDFSLGDCSTSIAPVDIPPRTFLKSTYFALPEGKIFIDKEIPTRYDPDPIKFEENSVFPMNYFVDLHNYVASFGNYNH